MCMYACVHAFLVFLFACLCVYAVKHLRACAYCCRRWELLNIHGVCARLGPRDKTFMFWQPESERWSVCVCVYESEWGWGTMGTVEMCRHQWFNGLNLTWAN